MQLPVHIQPLLSMQNPDSWAKRPTTSSHTKLQKLIHKGDLGTGQMTSVYKYTLC